MIPLTPVLACTLKMQEPRLFSCNSNFPLNLQIHPSNPISDDQDIDDASFGLVAQELAIRNYGIAGRVWEAAHAMTLYIHPMPNLEFDPPFIDASKATQGVTIIELGSGSGLIAVSVAKLLKPGRDHLIVTDLPEVCPLLENNLRPIMVKLEANSPNQDTLTIRPLSWGRWEDMSELASLFLEQRSWPRDSCKLTHIICSDLVYFPELLGPLLRSLLHITSPPFFHPKSHSCDCQSPAVFISCKIRSLAKETAFWSAFGLWFTFNPVLVKDKSAGGDWGRFGSSFDDRIFLFVAHRRAESYAWIVPALDEDLLCGVGANGTSLGKGDDSFENLLLMSIEQD